MRGLASFWFEIWFYITRKNSQFYTNTFHLVWVLVNTFRFFPLNFYSYVLYFAKIQTDKVTSIKKDFAFMFIYWSAKRNFLNNCLLLPISCTVWNRNTSWFVGQYLPMFCTSTLYHIINGIRFQMLYELFISNYLFYKSKSKGMSVYKKYL